MSISTQIQRIQQAKTNIKAAISDKGVTVPDNATIDTYPTYVSQISSGSGSGDGNFIDMIERDITSVIIPDGTTKIGDNAFRSCASLVEVIIPDSVKSIGLCAFYECFSLVEVIIPDGVTTIDTYTFYKCYALTNVTIPDTVKTLGNGAFQNCSSLKNVTIPDGVTSINMWTFDSCTSLTSITIPESVTSIQNYAFRDCSALTAITVLAATPPTLGTNAFSNTNNCPIYVPAASLNAYKTASNWIEYADRIFAITE